CRGAHMKGSTFTARNTVRQFLACVALVACALGAQADEDAPSGSGSSGPGGGSGGGGTTPDMTLQEVKVTGTREPGSGMGMGSAMWGIYLGGNARPSAPDSDGGAGGQPNKAAVPSDTNEKPNCQNPASKKPVILSTGEKYIEVGDFNASGLYGLSLSRNYHSKSINGAM